MKMPKSDSCWKFLKSYTPNGSQTLSKQPNRYVEGVYPKVLEVGSAGHVWDVDGNEYIDLISGLGALSLGYADPQVNAAIANQLMSGISFSLPTILEGEVARELCKLVPFTEQWKFGKNGVDATLMAIRAARAYTSRSKILVHGYHGCSDHFECLGTRQAGMIDMSDFSHKYDISKIAFNSDQYAAIIIEPYIFDLLDWRTVKEWCRQNGTLLIFDEVITGGRTEGFTASSMYKIEPDLICLGKAIANGMPLSTVGGKREIMATFERDDFFASTTFGGECLSLAACLATLDQLPSRISDMVDMGTEIKDCFNSLHGDKALCKGYPTRLTFDFRTPEHKALFMQEMCLQGILTGHSNFIMANHTDIDVTEICHAIEKSKKVLDRFWSNPIDGLNGKVPMETMRLR